MDSNFLRQFKPIKNPDVESLWDEFELSINHPGKTWEYYQILRDNFVSINFDSQFIADHFQTYWRWFVYVTWKNILAVSLDDFLLLFPKQFVPAFMLSELVEDQLFYYLFLQSKGNTQKVQELYLRVRDNCFKDNTPIFIHTHGVQTLHDLFTFIEQIDGETDETRLLNFRQQFEQMIFEKGKTFFEYSTEEKTQIMTNIIRFVRYLKSTQDIIPAYENYIASYLLDHDDDVSEEVRERAYRELARLAETKNINSFSTKNIFKELFEVLHSQYNIEHVEEATDLILELEKRSQDLGNSQIAELVYFDEQQQKFVWNDDLING